MSEIGRNVNVSEDKIAFVIITLNLLGELLIVTQKFWEFTLREWGAEKFSDQPKKGMAENHKMYINPVPNWNVVSQFF